MKRTLLSVVIASAFIAVPFASFAQTAGETTEKSGSQSAAPDSAASSAGSMENRYGSSPRCDSMTGADKEQCLRDEAEKTQNSQPDDKAAQGGAGSGSTSPTTPATESGSSASSTEAAPAGSGAAGAGAR